MNVILEASVMVYIQTRNTRNKKKVEGYQVSLKREFDLPAEVARASRFHEKDFEYTLVGTIYDLDTNTIKSKVFIGTRKGVKLEGEENFYGDELYDDDDDFDEEGFSFDSKENAKKMISKLEEMGWECLSVKPEL